MLACAHTPPSFLITKLVDASVGRLTWGTCRYYASNGMEWIEWLYVDLGRSVPLSDIQYFYHGQSQDARLTALQCYMTLWKDSSNATVLVHHYIGLRNDYYHDPTQPDWPTAAPNPGV